jgi:rubrerythrin
MEQFSVREVIEQAIQTEKLGYQFYMAMASKFGDEISLRELFETLASKEVEHEKTFTGLKEKIGDEFLENWDEASVYLKAIVESEFFLGNNKALPSLDHLKSAGDAVHYAMEFEKETILYFLGLKDSVKDAKIIEQIIDEEKSHIRWLSDLKKKL